MLQMGIIGAENSHCVEMAKLLNVQQAVACRVASVWGEKPRFAEAAATTGRIPKIVKDWREMLGAVDGVMITHRHPKPHYEVAKFFIENGVPCFVDKPFTFTLKEGRALCRLARKRAVPITSFSILVLQKTFRDFRKALKKVGRVDFLTSAGPAELKSRYGGIFFYGIHQVDPVIEMLGGQVDTAHLRAHGKGGVATLTYKHGPLVTIHCVNNGLWQFHTTATGDKGILDWTFEMDASPYIAGARVFTRMFQTGKEPFAHQRMLTPIAVLEALAKSLKSRRPVKVEACT